MGLDFCGIFFDVELRAHVDVRFFVVVCAAEWAVLGLGEFFEGFDAVFVEDVGAAQDYLFFDFEALLAD